MARLLPVFRMLILHSHAIHCFHTSLLIVHSQNVPFFCFLFFPSDYYVDHTQPGWCLSPGYYGDLVQPGCSLFSGYYVDHTQPGCSLFSGYCVDHTQPGCSLFSGYCVDHTQPGCSLFSGYYAWRNRERGSWYIEAVVKIFMKYAKCEDICAMLNRVCTFSPPHSLSLSLCPPPSPTLPLPLLSLSVSLCPPPSPTLPLPLLSLSLCLSAPLLPLRFPSPFSLSLSVLCVVLLCCLTEHCVLLNAVLCCLTNTVCCIVVLS